MTWAQIRNGHPFDEMRYPLPPWDQATPGRFARAWHPTNADWPLVLVEIRCLDDMSRISVCMKRDAKSVIEPGQPIPSETVRFVAEAINEYLI